VKKQVVNQPVVIVLAAGKGQRFLDAGGSTHKLQAQLQGRTVLQHTLAAVQTSGLACHVVHAAPRLQTMGDSIAQGVADCTQTYPHASAWLLLPADLPLVLPSTLQAVANALESGQFDAARPSFCGQSGHPVGFAASKRAELLNLKGFGGVVHVFNHSFATTIEVNDAGVLLDVDTPERLLACRDLLRKRA
jgi:molybdenum cofactor cytidylyltransferase